MAFDNNGVRAPGAKAYFYVGGTTTPYAVYADAAEGTARTQPVLADGNGRWPTVFIPFGTYKEFITTSGGTELSTIDNIPNAAPTDPTDTVDEDQLLQTGEVFFKFKDGARTGAVRANGRTIGSATSGATERANADCEDLFAELYTSLDNTVAPVSGGRGANAAADFAANKTLTLPDLRSRSPFGLETMGNTAAGRSSSIVPGYTASTNATLPGYAVGLNSHTLIEAELASHTHTGTTGTESQSHTHSGTTATESQSHTHSGTTGNQSADHQHLYNAPAIKNRSYSTPGLAGATWDGADTPTLSGVQSADHNHSFTSGNASQTHTHTITTGNTSQTHTHAITTNATGSNTAHNNVPNSVLVTWYIKL